MLKLTRGRRLQKHSNGNLRGIEMKPSSPVLLAVFVTVLLMNVFEVAGAQETGPDRGVQREPVSPAASVPEGVGAATSQPGRADGTGNPVLGRDRRPLYRFNKSDVVEISFAFASEFNQTAAVQPDGYITLKDAGHLVAEGLTASELEAAIAAAYGKLLHDPRVTVGLKDFDRPYFIAAGEVGRPGKYELRGPISISAALAIAGGFNEHAKHSQVVLFRHVNAKRGRSARFECEGDAKAAQSGRGSPAASRRLRVRSTQYDLQDHAIHARHEHGDVFHFSQILTRPMSPGCLSNGFYGGGDGCSPQRTW